MYEFNLAQRLSQLREQKGVSAREMSLDIGQNENYVNKIENGKHLPSLQMLYYICDYLDITPMEFFNTDLKYPDKLNNIISDLKTLSSSQLEAVHSIIKEMRPR